MFLDYISISVVDFCGFHLVDAACHLAATGVHITLFGQDDEDSGGLRSNPYNFNCFWV